MYILYIVYAIFDQRMMQRDKACSAILKPAYPTVPIVPALTFSVYCFPI